LLKLSRRLLTIPSPARLGSAASAPEVISKAEPA
jgi:hypothetical protein